MYNICQLYSNQKPAVVHLVVYYGHFGDRLIAHVQSIRNVWERD